jgi:hypothetical protein
MDKKITNHSQEKVINFQDMRKERLEERRREYERIVFKSALGVYTVMEQKGLQAIELVDISEGGLSFQVPEKSALRLHEGEQVSLRFYFATENYIPVDVKVVRSISAIENGVAVHRYGCLIDKTMASYSAIYHFVQFIAKCAEHGHSDSEHLKIFY